MSLYKDGRRDLRVSTVSLLASVAIIALMPTMATAQSMSEMQQRMTELEAQMKVLKAQINKAESRARTAERSAKAAVKKADEDNNTAVKWHLAGYAATSAFATDDGAKDDTFLAGRFNPVFHFQYKDLVMFESELEIEVESDGSTKTTLEYASIDLLIDDNATLVAGKFLSPIGQFQERLHPSWINKLPDAPAGFGHGGIQPGSDVGAMLRGGFDLAPMMLTYSVSAGNGPRIEYSGGRLTSIELDGFGSDDNNNKAVGGRVGFLPLPYLEIGGSLLSSKIEGRKEAAVGGGVSEGAFVLWGADAAYTRGPWDVRVEYLSAELDRFLSQQETADTLTSVVPKTTWEAWYAQAAYRLSGWTDAPIVKNVELVGRYGDFDVKGFGEFVEHAVPEKRWSLGVNYFFAPTFVGKLGVSYRDFKDRGLTDATEVRAELAYGF